MVWLDGLEPSRLSLQWEYSTLELQPPAKLLPIPFHVISVAPLLACDVIRDFAILFTNRPALVASLPGADLLTPIVYFGPQLLFLLHGVEPGTEDRQCRLLIAVLTSFCLAPHEQATGLMPYSHGGLDLVHVLAALTAAAHRIPFQIGLVDAELVGSRLFKYRYRDR